MKDFNLKYKHLSYEEFFDHITELGNNSFEEKLTRSILIFLESKYSILLLKEVVRMILIYLFLVVEYILYKLKMNQERLTKKW